MPDSYRERLVRDDLGSHPLTRPSAFQGPGTPVRLHIRPEGYEYPSYENWSSVPEDVKSKYNDYNIGPSTPEGRELSGTDQTGAFTKIGYLKNADDFELPEREAELQQFQQFGRSSETSGADETRGTADRGRAIDGLVRSDEDDGTTRPAGALPSDVSPPLDEGTEPAEGAPTVAQAGRRPTTPTESVAPRLETKDRSAVGDFIAETPVNVYTGVYRATREFNEFLGITPVVEAISNLDAVRAVVPEAARGAPPEASGPAGQIVQEFARFGTGLVPASATFKALGMVNSYVRLGMAGMVSDYAFMDPQEEGISEMLRDMGASESLPVEVFRQAVVNTFATSPNQTEFENRLRNALGGYVAGEALSGLVMAGGAAFRYMKNAAQMPDSTKRAILDQAERSAARQAERYPGGSSPVGAGIDPIDSFDRMVMQMAEVIKNSDISARTFYSALERNFEPFLNNNYHASQWKGVIKNFQNKGVRAAEIKWSGIEEWLDGQTGKISGRQVRDQIKERLPIIEPTDRAIDTRRVPIDDGSLLSWEEVKQKIFNEMEDLTWYKVSKEDAEKIMREVPYKKGDDVYENLYDELYSLIDGQFFDRVFPNEVNKSLRKAGLPTLDDRGLVYPPGEVPDRAKRIIDGSLRNPDETVSQQNISAMLGRRVSLQELRMSNRRLSTAELKEKFLRELEAREWYTLTNDKAESLFFEIMGIPRIDGDMPRNHLDLQGNFSARLWNQLNKLTQGEQYGLGFLDDELGVRGFPPIRELSDKGGIPPQVLRALDNAASNNFHPDFIASLQPNLGRQVTPEELGWVQPRRPSMDEPNFVLKNSPEDTRTIINSVLEPLRLATDEEVLAKGFPDRQSYDQLLQDLDNYFDDFIQNPDRSVAWDKVQNILREMGVPTPYRAFGTNPNPVKLEDLVKVNPNSRLAKEGKQQGYEAFSIHRKKLGEVLKDFDFDIVDDFGEGVAPKNYSEFTYRWENVPAHLKTSDEHFVGDDIVANSISYEVAGPQGQRYLFIDEIQSTPFQSMTPEQRAEYPVSDSWSETILRHMVRHAAELDMDGVVLSTREDNISKHGRSAEKLFKFLYDEKGPSTLKKITGDKTHEPQSLRSQDTSLAEGILEGIEDTVEFENISEFAKNELFDQLSNLSFGDYPVYRLDPETKRRVLTEGVPLWGAGAGLAAMDSGSFTGEEHQEASLLGEVLKQALKHVEPQRAITPPVRNAPTTVVDFGTLTSSGDIQRGLATYTAAFRGYTAGEKIIEEEKLSTLMGQSVNHTRRLHGGSIPSDVLYSKIQMINDSIRQVDYYTKLAVDNPTVENMANWVSQWRTHRAVAESFSGRDAVADDELSRFGPGRPGSGTVRQQEILEEFGGKGFAEYQLGLYSELKEHHAKSAFIRSSMWDRSKDAVYAAWINGLLSNPATQVVNFTSTAAFMGFRIPERLAAGMVPGGDITPGEAPLMAAGYIHGVLDVMRLGKLFVTDNMFQNAPTRQYSDFRKYLGELGFDDAYKKLEAGEKYNVIGGAAFEQDGYIGAGLDMMGWALTWPGRAIQLTDAFTKAIAYRGELYSMAYRHANRVLKETGDEAQATQAFNDAINFPSETMHKAAVNSARVVTFTKELGNIGSSFQSTVDYLPMGRFFIPFIRTPGNLLKEGFRRTAGVNLLTPTMRADLRAGGTRRQEAVAALGVSATLAAVAAYLASEGLLTGTVDFDNRSYYQQLSLSGQQRYSVKVGDDYYSIGRFEPLATPLAIWADAYHVMSYIDNPEDRDLIANAAVASVVEVVRQKAFLQSFSGLSDVIFSKDASNVSSLLEREVGRQASSLVPNIISKSGPAFEMMGVMDNDPHIRLTDVDEDLFDESMIGVQTFYRVLNEVKARTPGLSDDLPPLRGAFAEPIRRGQGTLADMFSPFYYSEGKFSKVGKELEKLGTYVSLPPGEYQGVKLSPELRDRLNVIRANEVIVGGRNFQEHLEFMFSSPIYQNLPTDDLKIMELRAEVSDFNQMAMDLLVRENPRLEERAQQLERQLYGME